MRQLRRKSPRAFLLIQSLSAGYSVSTLKPTVTDLEFNYRISPVRANDGGDGLN